MKPVKLKDQPKGLLRKPGWMITTADQSRTHRSIVVRSAQTTADGMERIRLELLCERDQWAAFIQREALALGMKVTLESENGGAA